MKIGSVWFTAPATPNAAWYAAWSGALIGVMSRWQVTTANRDGRRRDRVTARPQCDSMRTLLPVGRRRVRVIVRSDGRGGQALAVRLDSAAMSIQLAPSRLALACLALLGLAGAAPAAELAPGGNAPDFALPGSDGKLHRLEDYVGKQGV